ncbi:MAG: PEGA domain-containing protein [Candidatus Kryptonium sp.]
MKRIILVLFALFLFYFPLLSQQRDTTESLRGIGLKLGTDKGGSPFFKRSWALIIGINEYVKANKLRYALNDAEAVANLLIKKYGFGSKYVIKLYDSDATKENILKAFERLIKETFEDDRVFVFFAGHGITVPLPEGKERGYILPVDADPSQPVLTAISTDQLNEISEAIPAKHLYFVMDACYGGLIFARSQPTIAADAISFVEIVSKRRTRQALTAGGRDQPVFDTGPGGHSVFTFHLLKGLDEGFADLDKNGIITASELASYILPRVTSESRGQQTPQYGILVGDRGGEFVFIPRMRVSMLEVKSEPEGADIYINGEKLGKTPLDVDIYEFGKYKVELKLDGYFDYMGEFEISEDYHDLNVKLEKAGFLEVVSTPIGADVILNGKVVGKTPLYLPKLKKDKHVIKLALADYQDYSQEVDLVSADRVKVEAKLEKMRSKVNLVGIRGNVDVLIKGEGTQKNISRLPAKEIELVYGVYEIKLNKLGYHSTTRKIKVDKPDMDVVLTMEPKSKSTSIILSALLPGAGQIYMGREDMGMLLIVSEIAAGAFTVNYFFKYIGYKNEYEKYRNLYLSANDIDKMENYYSLMRKNYDSMKKSKNYFFIGSGVVSAIWLFNLVDAIIFSPDKVYSERVFKVGVRGSSINVSIGF